MKDVEIPNWLKELPLAPVFYPTDTEFADPIAYISKIEKEASAFGICKVIPPLPKPTKKYVTSNLNKSLLKSPELGNDVKFNNVEKVNDRELPAVFTTRHQELGHNNGKRTKEVGPGAGAGAGSSQPPPPTVYKQVWQSGEIYTLDQFESKSKMFARSQLGMIKEVSPLTVESLFWKAALEKPIYIEYANDVPGSGFGEPEEPSRFLHRHRKRRTFNRYNKDCSSDIREQLSNCESVKCSTSCSVDMLMKNNNSLDGGNEIEGTSGWKLSNCPWNLQVIARSPGSLTRFMPDDIPGVTSPMVYIGMLFSWFAWHVEDHELHSLNFLHYGSPKTWYAIPGDYAFTFEEVIRSKAYGGINRLAALTLLGEKTTLLSPEIVVASGIPCCRLVQNPGEFVVTFPRAYHKGFSHGFNCGEAANFGTPKWLSVAKEAAVRRAAMNFLPMLSHQQLLYLLTMSFIPRVPKSLLPGIRSSRLKDRQKEEREILVKKEFIEDLLKENKLLNYILQRNSSYRAIQWNIESLSPSLIEESDLTNIENVNVNSNNKLYTEISVHIEDEDMSSDFQIDSGTLPCVACGVLGYPFMSVIQPSANIAFSETELVNVEDQSLEVSKDSSKVNVEKGWNVSNGYLRPRIFCLEHASKIEEMLNSMGGSKLLIICHSDFQKIKVQVSAIAEQIGSTFRYNEVQLDDANRDDLDLINLAIDNEQKDETVEDWTLKLNVNLKQSVKLRPKLSSDKLHHALTMDALFADVPPTSSATIFQWQATKSRSNRKLNCLNKKLSKKTISVVKDVELKEKLSEAKIPIKERGFFIQYSRRTFKSKPKDSVILSPENPNLQHECGHESSPGSVSCATTIENSGIEKDDINGEEIGMQNETSFVVTKNDSVEQEGSELTKLGGSSADETVTDSNVKVKISHITDENDENNPVSGSASGSKRKRELLQREEKSNFDTTIENSGIEKDDINGEEIGMQNETSFVVTKNDSVEQEGSELTKLGGSSADEPVTDSNVKVKKSHITDENDENNPVSGLASGSKRKREVELLQREEKSNFDTTIENSGIEKDDINGEEIGMQNETSFVVTKNDSVEQEGSELTKLGGSSADEPVTDSNVKVKKSHITDENDENNPVSGLASGSKRKREVELLQREEKSNFDTTIENSGIEKDDINGEEIGMQNETSFVVTKNDSVEQEGSELTKLGGSSADEPVTDSNVKVKKSHITDENDENNPVSGLASGSKRKREVELLQREEKSNFDTTIENSGIEKDDINGEEIGMQNETSFVVTKNDSVEQEGSELTKLGGSSADEPVTDSNVKVKKSHITDENDENNPVSGLASGSKRKREVELLQREEKSNFDAFIKSPCEGLRPRGEKDLHKDGIFIMTKTIPEKATKKSKVSNVKIPEKHQHGSHKCDHEGCKLSFKTKTELSLHRKNRCPVEGCGKKFSSHRYAVVHLRVHEDSRPLKCSWKGCKMTFKWAWARTEHLRVHTGERPYKCNLEGCGLTFRFVSDFSRHRRKTGHNVHVKA